MDETGLDKLLRAQHGVLCRRQVIELGGDDVLVERRIRRRDWAVILTGVYVAHTGPPTWHQRAWAAILYAQPAALSGRSALHAHGVRGHEEPAQIEVATSDDRRVRAAHGIVVRRLSDFDRIAQQHLSPPRLRIEAALLRVAAAARTEDEAVAVLADACQSGVTLARRLADELTLTPTLRRRRLLAEIVGDVAVGALSALERRYLRDVERAHGLPVGRRQVVDTVAGSRVRRDVEYAEQATEVELDGVLGHEAVRDRWDDLDRDLGTAVSGKITLRLGWRQVLQPCRTALAVGRILTSRGWTGQVLPCCRACPMS